MSSIILDIETWQIAREVATTRADEREMPSCQVRIMFREAECRPDLVGSRSHRSSPT
jgi:hypothetical protein